MSTADRMPAAFFGHGSPMNAIADNAYTRAWKAFGASCPRPRAILAVSAHWTATQTAVTASASPKTIHDFTGWPKALYEMHYAAPGDPALAAEIASSLAPLPVALDQRRGLDHGVWSVLVHAFPAADVPVLQLALDETKPPSFHLDLGTKLSAWRDHGVLVMASGNVVHNLEHMHAGGGAPYEWAERFDRFVADALERQETASLADYERHPDAAIAAPDPEHFHPLLYVAGARRAGDGLRTVAEGFDLRSVSMRAFQVG